MERQKILNVTQWRTENGKEWIIREAPTQRQSSSMTPALTSNTFTSLHCRTHLSLHLQLHFSLSNTRDFLPFTSLVLSNSSRS